MGKRFHEIHQILTVVISEGCCIGNCYFLLYDFGILCNFLLWSINYFYKEKNRNVVKKNKVVRDIHVLQINMLTHNSKDPSLAPESGHRNTNILACSGSPKKCMFLCYHLCIFIYELSIICIDRGGFSIQPCFAAWVVRDDLMPPLHSFKLARATYLLVLVKMLIPLQLSEINVAILLKRAN